MTPLNVTGVANHCAPVVTPWHGPGWYRHFTPSCGTVAADSPVSGVRLLWVLSPSRCDQSAAQPAVASTTTSATSAIREPEPCAVDVDIERSVGRRGAGGTQSDRAGTRPRPRRVWSEGAGRVRSWLPLEPWS